MFLNGKLKRKCLKTAKSGVVVQDVYENLYKSGDKERKKYFTKFYCKQCGYVQPDVEMHDGADFVCVRCGFFGKAREENAVIKKVTMPLHLAECADCGAMITYGTHDLIGRCCYCESPDVLYDKEKINEV